MSHLIMKLIALLLMTIATYATSEKLRKITERVDGIVSSEFSKREKLAHIGTSTVTDIFLITSTVFASCLSGFEANACSRRSLKMKNFRKHKNLDGLKL